MGRQPISGRVSVPPLPAPPPSTAEMKRRSAESKSGSASHKHRTCRHTAAEVRRRLTIRLVRSSGIARATRRAVRAELHLRTATVELTIPWKERALLHGWWGAESPPARAASGAEWRLRDHYRVVRPLRSFTSPAAGRTEPTLVSRRPRGDRCGSRLLVAERERRRGSYAAGGGSAGVRGGVLSFGCDVSRAHPRLAW